MANIPLLTGPFSASQEGINNLVNQINAALAGSGGGGSTTFAALTDIIDNAPHANLFITDVLPTGIVSPTAQNNVAYGNYCLNALTVGSANTAVGSGALIGVTTGTNNSGFGNNAGQNLVSGIGNTCIGDDAGPPTDYNYTISLGQFAEATASNWAQIGAASGPYQISNIRFGDGTAILHADGSALTGLPPAGATTFAALTDIVANTSAGNYSITSTQNTFGGVSNTSMGNVAFGSSAGTTGARNTSFGAAANINVSTGGANTSIGTGATPTSDLSNTTNLGASAKCSASNTIQIGAVTGNPDGIPIPTDCTFGDGTVVLHANGSSLTGLLLSQLTDIIDDVTNFNTFVTGTNPIGLVHNTAQLNSAFGTASMVGITTGTANTVFGANAGPSNHTGSQNTLLGANTDTTGSAAINRMALGYGVTVGADNTVQIGNNSVTDVYFGNGSTSVLHTKSITNDGTNIWALGAYSPATPAVQGGTVTVTINGTPVTILTT